MVHPVALICFSGKDVREMHHGMYGYFGNITLESVVVRHLIIVHAQKRLYFPC